MTRYAVAVLVVSTVLAAPAEPASMDLREAIANGKASLGFRYRYEEVEQAFSARTRRRPRRVRA